MSHHIGSIANERLIGELELFFFVNLVLHIFPDVADVYDVGSSNYCVVHDSTQCRWLLTDRCRVACNREDLKGDSTGVQG